LADEIARMAASAGTQHGFVQTALLIAASGCLGGLVPVVWGDRREPATLMAALVGPSSVGKGRALAPIRSQLEEIEAQEHAGWDAQRQALEAMRLEALARRKIAAETIHGLLRAGLQPPPVEVPQPIAVPRDPPSLVVDLVTEAALAISTTRPAAAG
jgi:hypothetical protein